MKKRIAVGAAMLLTLGSAVAGSMMYAHEDSSRMHEVPVASVSEEITPEVLAMWQANAASSDYIAPKVPI